MNYFKKQVVIQYFTVFYIPIWEKTYWKSKASLAVTQARSQPDFFLGGREQGHIMQGQNFFVYSDENEGIKCLYQYYTRMARTVFYEFTLENMYEVLGSKAKVWGSAEAVGGLGSGGSSVWRFLEFFN